MDGRAGVIRFSLASVPEEDRAAAMREVTGRAVMNVDIRSIAERPELDMELWSLPAITVGLTRVSAQVTESGYDPSLQDDDFIFGWEASRSPAQIEQVGRTFVFSQGTAVLLSAADPYRSINNEVCHPRTIKIRRSVLLPFLPHAEDLIVRPLSREAPGFKLLKSYLQMLKRVGLPTDDEVGRVVSLHIAELVALCFTTNGNSRFAAGDGVRAARLAAAKAFAIEHLSDPSLSVNDAAAALRVTPRYVQMLFESDSTTFTAFVLKERLTLAYKCFANPLLNYRAISAIAFDAGFGDLSYFNRAFRAAFGESPSDVRHRAEKKGDESPQFV